MKHYVFSEYCNISDDEKVYVVSVSSSHSTTVRAHWRITPLSKYLVNPIYNPFRPFGRRPTTPIKGLTITTQVPHSMTGPILPGRSFHEWNQETSRSTSTWSSLLEGMPGAIIRISVRYLCVLPEESDLAPRILRVFELLPKLTAGRSTQKAIISPLSGVKCS